MILEQGLPDNTSVGPTSFVKKRRAKIEAGTDDSKKHFLGKLISN